MFCFMALCDASIMVLYTEKLRVVPSSLRISKKTAKTLTGIVYKNIALRNSYEKQRCEIG